MKMDIILMSNFHHLKNIGSYSKRRRKMKKYFREITIFILLCLVPISYSLSNYIGASNNKEIKYTMYVGLNDKDTYKQIISTSDAEKKVEGIILKYLDGFTRIYGRGAYMDEKKTITRENSLIYIFYSATDEDVKSIMNEIIKELNQNSVLIEKEKIDYEFYEGVKQ